MDAIDAAVWLDGNAVAGPLQELFAWEVTAAQLTCAGCGAVLLRLVHGGGRTWLDLTGVRCLELAEP